VKRVEQENLFAKFIKYNLSCLVGVGLNIAILWAVTELFSVHYLISNLFGIAVAVIWNYYVSVKWVWMRKIKE
jgi:dolichol-phosphate mannosyltransferase